MTCAEYDDLNEIKLFNRMHYHRDAFFSGKNESDNEQRENWENWKIARNAYIEFLCGKVGQSIFE